VRVIPGRRADLGLARDRHFEVPKSAKADLGAANPEFISAAVVMDSGCAGFARALE
jgi:hypothetical protein